MCNEMLQKFVRLVLAVVITFGFVFSVDLAQSPTVQGAEITCIVYGWVTGSQIQGRTITVSRSAIGFPSYSASAQTEGDGYYEIGNIPCDSITRAYKVTPSRGCSTSKTVYLSNKIGANKRIARADFICNG